MIAQIGISRRRALEMAIAMGGLAVAGGAGRAQTPPTPKIEQLVPELEKIISTSEPLCCTDQQPGAVSPRSDILREANVLRPPKLEHPVQRGDSNGHLGHLPTFGPRA